MRDAVRTDSPCAVPGICSNLVDHYIRGFVFVTPPFSFPLKNNLEEWARNRQGPILIHSCYILNNCIVLNSLSRQMMFKYIMTKVWSAFTHSQQSHSDRVKIVHLKNKNKNTMHHNLSSYKHLFFKINVTLSPQLHPSVLQQNMSACQSAMLQWGRKVPSVEGNGTAE